MSELEVGAWAVDLHNSIQVLLQQHMKEHPEIEIEELYKVQGASLGLSLISLFKGNMDHVDEILRASEVAWRHIKASKKLKPIEQATH